MFPYSWGSRETVRHAFWIHGLWHPHSTHSPSKQVCHSWAPPQALEMEEEEEWEVQADLCWYLIFFFFLNFTVCQQMQMPVVSIVLVQCNSVYIFWQNVSVSWVNENAANWSSKSAALTCHVLKSLLSSFDLAAQCCQGRVKDTLSSGVAAFISAWPVLKSTVSLVDRGRHFVTLCLAGWKQNSCFCRRTETSRLSRIGCYVFAILLN